MVKTVAASFVGKDRPFIPSSHVFHFNPYTRIPPAGDRLSDPRVDSGHDAFFVSRVGGSGAIAIGVADGVGGWVDSGVDPADFSHTFCDYMARTAYLYESPMPPDGDSSGTTLNARYLMQMGYDLVSKDKNIHAGGSTACVAVASPDGSLDVANLGDSGYVALRANAVHAYSVPQTHSFNTPFQLSVIPHSILRRAALFGNNMLLDRPKDSDVTSINLRHGDVLVFASDGVWDNLFNHDILRIVSRLMTDVGAWRNGSSGITVARNLDAFTGVEVLNEQAAAKAGANAKRSQGEGTASSPSTRVSGGIRTLQSALAVEITAAAKAASLNARVDGPFAKTLKQYYPNEKWNGGKVDDICVVVAIVTEQLRDTASADDGY
ncbi:5-azacytidine resistance protein azr1 [Zalerion maritima]|uniref:Protein phosphatase n=1 Tax=Zalerion maritima TaxID=339359 RepID=A0AAD5WU64_9PEZI|nr:5-azacytidine resistance protein azr1 [Zalerion maritima]